VRRSLACAEMLKVFNDFPLRNLFCSKSYFAVSRGARMTLVNGAVAANGKSGGTICGILR
jgi:hypothetical protein